jgi:hypothetical protein
VSVSFIGGGNRSTRRKPQTCRMSLTTYKQIQTPKKHLPIINYHGTLVNSHIWTKQTSLPKMTPKCDHNKTFPVNRNEEWCWAERGKVQIIQTKRKHNHRPVACRWQHTNKYKLLKNIYLLSIIIVSSFLYSIFFFNF